jgi:uncharacterized protein YdeI (YjbR/CyaY-like superfamily)
MGSRDPRVDAYIANATDFAKPILTHLRAVVHEACPDAEETLKWRNPTFMYKGMLCGFASFKEHCVFGFWKSSLVLANNGTPADESLGYSGRLTKLSDLPSKKILAGYIKKAMQLNEDGVTVMRKVTPKKSLVIPADLSAALKKSKKALTTFDAFSPSKKRDYVEWITGAKTDDTRRRRLTTAVEWIAEGKSRNWKYENC